jgi:hypothetical protein
MRAETLYRLSLRIYHDIKNSGAVALLTQLSAALEARTSDSSEATQQNVETALQQLAANLNSSSFNSASALEREILASMDADDLVGQALLSKVNAAISPNENAPNVARLQVDQIRKDVEALYNEADSLTDALQHFNVVADELEPAEFEVTVAIPSSVVDCELAQFAREALRINQIMGVFSELATGAREPVKINAVSSSDLTLYLAAIPSVAAIVAVALERIVALYEKILNIKKLHRDLNSLKLPENLLSPIREYIDKQVGTGLEEIAREIEGRRLGRIATSRRQEIKTELRTSLRQIANRLDRGYGFDVRGEDAAAVENEASNTPASRAAAKTIGTAYKIVQDARSKIRHFQPGSEPILGLPEPSSDANTPPQDQK